MIYNCDVIINVRLLARGNIFQKLSIRIDIQIIIYYHKIFLATFDYHFDYPLK